MKFELPKSRPVVPSRGDINEKRDLTAEKWERIKRLAFWSIILLVIMNYVIFFR